ncbi:MAG: cyclic nucleotide-binding domain-containing protein [Desulfatitalea sp.]|nr:cyclic nucleotide-binding domain-containing protein [Desulfatitalea sp.]
MKPSAPSGAPTSLNLESEQSRLKQLLQEGQTQEAVRLLSQMAVACARNQDFERADGFRDQLYEVDSMALKAILAVNEVIEAEKGRALTPDRRMMWARFFEMLSTEEANAFFFALKEQTLESEQTVLVQGEPNDRLYLINQGQLKITHEHESRQALIHTIGAGETIGEDTFFSVNVCTATLTTLSRVKLSYLEREKLDGIKIQHPLLETHLQKICGSGRKIFDWLRQKGIDRRAVKRVNLNTKITFQVLTPDDPSTLQRSVIAELWDISKCGLSFYFQSKSPEAVRRLVGRTLGVNFTLAVAGQKKEISLTGVVHGVQNHPLDEYSVHLQLRRNFSDEAIKTIFRLAEQD